MRPKTKQHRPSSSTPAVPKALTGVFSALSDPRRYGMFCLLMRDRGVCVSEIASMFRISIPAASQQLRVLERSGVILRERIGRKTCYRVRLDDPVVKNISLLCARTHRRLVRSPKKHA